ncbi:MAG: hypothetical protein DRG11_02275 [Epsilonproteobacteria bacterium]|nr:MAG: hypothetical protein DRG11_02275 [Campylobacterota bacterium]
MFDDIKVFLKSQQRLLLKLDMFFDEANFAFDDDELEDTEQMSLNKADKIVSKILANLKDNLNCDIKKYSATPIYHKLIFTILYKKDQDSFKQTFEITISNNSFELKELEN